MEDESNLLKFAGTYDGIRSVSRGWSPKTDRSSFPSDPFVYKAYFDYLTGNTDRKVD